MNPGDNLDNNGEELLMTMMTTCEHLLTQTTTGEDLLMTREDNTDDRCDDNVLCSY
jgi:hypothetical protein